LSTAELLRAIRELQDLGVCIIGLTGGEPLLRDDLESVVRSVDARSTTLLFTSGDGLDLVRARRLKESGLFGVAVSLDHVEAETHDRGRGQKGAFLAACRAIEAGREAGLYTMAQLVARREVADESWLRRYLDFVGGLGVQEVRLLEPMPTGLLLGTSGTTGIGCTGREELRKVHRRSNRVSTGVKVSSFAVIEDSEHYGCGAGFQHLYIDAHGHVCPCDFSPISFGNVATEPVGSIWLRMRESFQRPRCECFLQTRAQEISRAFKGELPLEVARVPERVFRCEDERLPSYYRVLGWQEDGASGQGWNVRRAGGMTCVPEAGDAA
jgi:MoaA/NifB/PqqE/SkfB family radical SAM enzyme